MSIIWNGTEIDGFRWNGAEPDAVHFNGVEVWSALTLTGGARDQYDFVIGGPPFTVSLSLQFNTDGTTTKSVLPVGTNWGSPTTIAIGSDYEIQFTSLNVTGETSYTIPTVNVWHSLGSAREIIVTRTGVTGTADLYVDYEIRKISSPTNNTTGSINLVAQYDTGI